MYHSIHERVPLGRAWAEAFERVLNASRCGERARCQGRNKNCDERWFEVLSVERLEHSALWKRYVTEKNAMALRESGGE